MNWSCTDTEEHVSDFLDRTLPAEDFAACSEHQTRCLRCAELVAQVGMLVRQMQHTEAIEMPERLVANILNSTLGPRQKRDAFDQWLGWLGVLWQPRFAIGVLTAACSLTILMHASGQSLSTASWADLNPANFARYVNRQAHLTSGRAEKFVDDLRLVYEIRSQLEPDELPQEATPARTVPPPERSPASTHEQQKQPEVPPNAPPKAEARPKGEIERSHRVAQDGRLLAMTEDQHLGAGN